MLGLGLGLAAALLSGCDQKPLASQAHGSASDFDPVAFFSGHTRSWGVIENRSGAPTQQIMTEGLGTSRGADGLVMTQHLTFQDGTMQQRDWTLWRSGPNQFDATANDMVGMANGQANGRVFHWKWVLARAPGNHLLDVTMNQWMYRLEDGSVMILYHDQQAWDHPGRSHRAVYPGRKRSGGDQELMFVTAPCPGVWALASASVTPA